MASTMSDGASESAFLEAFLEVEDLLLGYKFQLRGKTHRIALDPAERSVVIWRLSRPDRVAV